MKKRWLLDLATGRLVREGESLTDKPTMPVESLTGNANARPPSYPPIARRRPPANPNNPFSWLLSAWRARLSANSAHLPRIEPARPAPIPHSALRTPHSPARFFLGLDLGQTADYTALTV